MFRVLAGGEFYQNLSFGRKDLFLDYISLKGLGYKERYEKTIMPLDQADFFSTFYVTYKWQHGKWFPAMVQRFVSQNECYRFNVPFGIEAMIKNSGNEQVKIAFESLIQKERYEDILYPSSFTINPNLEFTKEDKEVFLELTASFHLLELKKRGDVFFLTSAVEKFKTYRVLEKVGHRFICDEPLVKKKNFWDELVLIMGTNKLSSFCYESLEKHRHIIGEEQQVAA